MTRETILEKVRKLLNLAKDAAATPGEAAAAAARAQAMLFEHRLSMTDVDLGGDQPAEDYKVHEHSVGGGANLRAWRQALLNTIARNNFCRMVIYSRSNPKVELVGRAADVEFVKWLFDSLVVQIDGMARVWAAANVLPGGNRNRAIRAFGLGAVRTIGERLAAQRAKDEVASTQSQALVRVSDAALKDAMDRYFPKLGRSRGATSGDGNAYAGGRRAAQTLGINRPIGGAATRAALGA